MSMYKVDFPMLGKSWNVVAQSLDSVLREHGFTRRKKTWYRREEETILLVNLQKSDVGEDFYINLGILIRRLSENPAPKVSECHIMERLESIALGQRSAGGSLLCAEKASPQGAVKALRETLSKRPRQSLRLDLSEESLKEILRNRPRLHRALDLEDRTLMDEERRCVIRDALLKVGLPFLEKCVSVRQIRDALRRGELRGAGVSKIVYDLCGVRQQ